MATISDLAHLDARLEGSLYRDDTQRAAYAVDASLFQETPLAVAHPKSAADIQELVRFAAEHGIGLIPRAAGTSLAGQCVGDGLVVDGGRYLRDIHLIDPENQVAEVDPGVIQQDLNDAAGAHGLIFGPDTSTADRCMIAGMVGNNACGAYSVLHGTTREHLLRAEVVLADGSMAVFEDLDAKAYGAKQGLDSFEGRIYRELHGILQQNAQAIRDALPDPRVRRRNTAYALDALLDCEPFTPGGPPFNLCRLLAGSEGTLAFLTKATVNLVPTPKERRLVVVHCRDIPETARVTVIALDAGCVAAELMDDMIMDAGRSHPGAARDCHWIEGNPGGVLAVEFFAETSDELAEQVDGFIRACRDAGEGYAFPSFSAQEMGAVWRVRKAGLGLLMGLTGKKKSTTVIEDTAVPAARLEAYVHDIGAIIARHGIRCCHYGHASVGLLHLRPNMDLADPHQREVFTALAEEVADLVKTYRGSLSGEHGDGRLRAPYLQRVLGPQVMAAMAAVKELFDPKNVFNPQKIIDPKPLTDDLRVDAQHEFEDLETAYDWSATGGLVGAMAQCNGAGVCRRSPGRGTMCPSYQATSDERHSTRGRANVLRQVFSREADLHSALEDPAVAEVLRLCLSCKACIEECPSTVDMARLKSEIVHQQHRRKGYGFREYLVGDFNRQAKFASKLPRLSNWALNLNVTKKILGIHPGRNLPAFARKSFVPDPIPDDANVILVVDHFAAYQEPDLARAAIHTCEQAGYRVGSIVGLDDGRTWISTGFLDKAREAMLASVAALAPYAHKGVPIVGLEPSAFLGLRDEGPGLLRHHPEALGDLSAINEQGRLFDEFVAENIDKFSEVSFEGPRADVFVHGHCHEKSLVGDGPLIKALSCVPQLTVTPLATGCCGMAGAFGYRADTYDISMQVAETSLFPQVRALDPNALLCAPGTSCRHQLADGLGKVAEHPAIIIGRYCGFVGSASI